jgi:pimeloyl-ACP methyl ester carboxylesterase
LIPREILLVILPPVGWEESVSPHPYSTAVAWDGVGHWIQQERAAEFNALVLDWIAGLPAVDDKR